MLSGIAITLMVLGVALILFGLRGNKVWILGKFLSKLWGEFAQGIGFLSGLILLVFGIWLYPTHTVDRSVVNKKVIEKQKEVKQLERVSTHPGTIFRDCPDCPEMVVLPRGKMTMGASDNDPNRTASETPSHPVVIDYSLAVGRYEVTFAEWNLCSMAGGCRRDVITPAGYAQHPVVNINWQDAQNYLAWLKKITGFDYRLLTEAEWEYAARAAHETRYTWGAEIAKGRASCSNCVTLWKEKDTFVVGAFPENDFKLFEMHGNVREWVGDCWHDNYVDAPQDGNAWLNSCSEGRRITRGGAWNMSSQELRVTARGRETWNQVSNNLGFRIARIVP